MEYVTEYSLEVEFSVTEYSLDLFMEYVRICYGIFSSSGICYDIFSRSGICTEYSLEVESLLRNIL